MQRKSEVRAISAGKLRKDRIHGIKMRNIPFMRIKKELRPNTHSAEREQK